MADIQIDIELVTKAFNTALKQTTDQVQGFQLQVQKSQKGITTSFNKIDKSTKKTSQGFSVLKGSLASFVGNLAAGVVQNFTSALGQFGTSIIDNTIKLEQLTTQFTVLTGSAEVANDTLKDLQQFAATTPFQLENLATAGAQLIGFGVSADELIPRLQRIGDVAASVNKPIGDIALIFGQVQAAGKLTGERLLQLEERAVPVSEALAKALNVPRESVRRLVSEGKVDFETFQKAFDSLSDAGGQAFEGMIRQSKTLGGLISTLKDNFSLLGTDIGAVLLPALKEASAQLISFIQSNKELIVSIATSAINGMAQAISLAINAFNIFRAVITAVDVVIKSAFVAFEATKVAVLALAQGVVDATIALRELAGSDPSPTLQRISENLKMMKDQSKITTDDMVKDIKTVMAARDAEGKALQGLASEVRAFGSVVRSEEEKTTDKILTEQEKRDAAELAQMEKDFERERLKIQTIQEIRDELKANEDVAKIEAQISVLEEDEANLERIRELELKKVEIVRQAEIEKANAIKNETDKIRALEIANQKARIDALKVNTESAGKIRKRDFNNQKKLQEGSLVATQGFISAGLTLAKQGSAEQKALRIAEATINAYAAGARAYVDYPYPANIAVMAATIAQGLATVAKISSAGSFQNGGIVPGSSFSGDNLTANVNSGELILNRNQQQRLLNIARGTESSTELREEGANVQEIVTAVMQNMTVVLQADDTELARSVSRGIDNGIIIGST